MNALSKSKQPALLKKWSHSFIAVYQADCESIAGSCLRLSIRDFAYQFNIRLGPYNTPFHSIFYFASRFMPVITNYWLIDFSAEAWTKY
jgi:hypothetical protein